VEITATSLLRRLITSLNFAVNSRVRTPGHRSNFISLRNLRVSRRLCGDSFMSVIRGECRERRIYAERKNKQGNYTEEKTKA
jgi:hypothetical protein